LYVTNVVHIGIITMFPAVPALVAAFDPTASYEPTAADLVEQTLVDAARHPDVMRLLAAAREVLECNARGPSLAYLYQTLVPFIGIAAAVEPGPVSKPSNEPVPF
jgi:hypothetical protein